MRNMQITHHISLKNFDYTFQNGTQNNKITETISPKSCIKPIT